VANQADNCPTVANPGQTNTDGDGHGEACDADDDNDGVADGTDNCPLVTNASQTDADGDGLGDVCDANPTDGPTGDQDGDSVANQADNCPTVANTSQANLDGDAQGDACDLDDDNDTVADGPDNCPVVANPGQANTDGDGQGDACDADDDNDGFLDGVDGCPLVPGTVNGCPPGGDAAGGMNGNGSIEVGGKEYEFELKVDERVSGPESARLRLVIREKRQGRDVRNRFDSTGVTSIMFADHPAFNPGKKPTSGIDSVIFNGPGRWNGAAGYSYEVACTDMGEPGRGNDTFSVTIRAPGGAVMASAAGTLTKGNIQSRKAKK